MPPTEKVRLRGDPKKFMFLLVTKDKEEIFVIFPALPRVKSPDQLSVPPVIVYEVEPLVVPIAVGNCV